MSEIKYRRDIWRLVKVSGNAAEIGVAEGYFSADLLAMPVQFPKVFMVDRWQSTPGQKGDASNPQAWHDKNYEQAMLRVAKFGERAVPLRGDSDKMAVWVSDASLSLCYIDGDHSYSGVVQDIQAWLPKVMPGGVMGFHDYLNKSYGVFAAVNDFFRGRCEVYTITEDKVEDAGAYIIKTC